MMLTPPMVMAENALIERLMSIHIAAVRHIKKCLLLLVVLKPVYDV
jgi:hypothetical protein